MGHINLSGVWLAGINRKQGQAQIAHFLEYALHGGLISQWVAQERIAVLLLCDGQILEPFGPALIQVTNRVPQDAGRLPGGCSSQAC